VVVGAKELQIQEALLDTGNTCISIPSIYTDDILNQFHTKNNICKFDA
jgi:hypothetical protein